MKLSRSRPTPGCRTFISLAAAATITLLGASACNYGFSGGGGFPSSLHTVCIKPFDNQTDHSELTGEIFDALNRKLPGELGLRPGDCNGGADAVVTGKIVSYDDAASAYQSNPSSSPSQAANVQVNQSQVTITIAARIVDTQDNIILWESSGVRGQGTYDPAKGDATPGRTAAVTNLVQAIVDGAQSQW